MLNPPPRTGDTALDNFLRSVYDKSHELELKSIPEEGWSLTDFTAEVSGVIGDKRDLIDIVTQYDSIEDYLALIDNQEQLLQEALDRIESIDVSAEWFAQIMEWWDQNYKIIQDAQESLTYKREADAAALEAKGHAEETEQDRQATAENLSDAREAASDAANYRDTALTYRESSKTHREASEAAKRLSEAARDLAEQFRDGAKAHREAASTSEVNAATSASAASTDANAASESAGDAAAEHAKTEDVRVEVESIESALRQLMADTEAWQDVSYALESVDSRISTGMENVKNDILGGAGPAFDTLLELAEALGDNADAIGTITNELANKSDKSHTHVSADITDATTLTGSGDNEKVVKTGSDGHVHSGQHPTGYNHLTRRGWVDGQLAKKANTSHTHTISETSGLQAALDAKSDDGHIHSIGEVDGLEAQLAARAAEGHTHEVADITDLPEISKNNVGNTIVQRSADGTMNIANPIDYANAATKGYVDDEVWLMSGAGASIIPSIPDGSDSGIQKWASRLPTGGSESTPTGRYYSSEGSHNSEEAFFQVDPGVDYYASMWVNADKAGSVMYIELRDQDGDHAVESGNLNGAGTYLLGNHEMPTSWTQLETTKLRFTEKARYVKVASIYWNHAKGDVQDATQYLTDIQLMPIPKLSSKDISDATSLTQEDDDNVVVKTGSDGHIHSGQSPTGYNHLTRKGWVDARIDNHSHEISDVNGLQEALNDAGTAEHTHTIGEVDGLDTTLSGKADQSYVDAEIGKKSDVSHTHTIDEVDGLDDALASKADTTYVDAEVGKKADKSYVDSRKAVWIHHGGVFEPDPNAAEGDAVFDLSTNKIHEIIDGMI